MLNRPYVSILLQAARERALDCQQDIDALIEIASLMQDYRDERSAIGVDVRLLRVEEGWEVDGRIITL